LWLWFKKISLKKVWLVGFRYVFDKNYGSSLCIAKNMYKMFGESVVPVAFQSVFYLKMHQNIFFYFLKIIFDISVSKWFENTKNISIWSKEKNKKIYIFSKTLLKRKAKQGFTKLN
jgi:hypothetical protein